MEGLDLSLVVSYQYKYDPDNLIEIYRNFEESTSVFKRIARNSVLQIASENAASIYWTKRRLVGKDMLDELTKMLKKVNIEVKGFHLLYVSLD